MIETLDTTGFLVTENGLEMALLDADFGDGLGVALRSGSVEGLRTWTIRVDVLPGTEQGSTIPNTLGPSFLLTEEGGYLLLESGGRIILEAPVESHDTRATYLWKFFHLSKAAGNQPFWIEAEDPGDGTRKKFLTSFVDDKLSYTVLCAQVYSTGLQLKQRRLPGVASPVAI